MINRCPWLTPCSKDITCKGRIPHEKATLYPRHLKTPSWLTPRISSPKTLRTAAPASCFLTVQIKCRESRCDNFKMASPATGTRWPRIRYLRSFERRAANPSASAERCDNLFRADSASIRLSPGTADARCWMSLVPIRMVTSPMASRVIARSCSSVRRGSAGQSRTSR